MKLGKAILAGLGAGLIMGIVLFFAGAIAARIVYGPQMVPTGKFRPEQIHVWYFIWTKLLIGSFFGVLFSVLYEVLPLSKRIDGRLAGMKYAFLLWVVVHLWALSHPFTYEAWSAVFNKNQLFWTIYSLVGFLGLGAALGWLRNHKVMTAS